MKTYKLNVKDYKVGKETTNCRNEFSSILRMAGVYDNGVETCDGVFLAKRMMESNEDELLVSEIELALLKKVMDVLIKRPHNPAMGQISLGGPRYEEMILRVFQLDKE